MEYFVIIYINPNGISFGKSIAQDYAMGVSLHIGPRDITLLNSRGPNDNSKTWDLDDLGTAIIDYESHLGKILELGNRRRRVENTNNGMIMCHSSKENYLRDAIDSGILHPYMEIMDDRLTDASLDAMANKLAFEVGVWQASKNS